MIICSAWLSSGLEHLLILATIEKWHFSNSKLPLNVFWYIASINANQVNTWPAIFHTLLICSTYIVFKYGDAYSLIYAACQKQASSVFVAFLREIPLSYCDVHEQRSTQTIALWFVPVLENERKNCWNLYYMWSQDWENLRVTEVLHHE